MQYPQGVAANLMPGRLLAFPESLGTGIGPWRSVNRDTFPAEHLLNAENVVTVAHGEAEAHFIGIHDGADSSRGLGCIRALRFRNELAVRDAKSLEVLAANHALGEAGIA